MYTSSEPLIWFCFEQPLTLWRLIQSFPDGWHDGDGVFQPWNDAYSIFQIRLCARVVNNHADPSCCGCCGIRNNRVSHYFWKIVDVKNHAQSKDVVRSSFGRMESLTLVIVEIPDCPHFWSRVIHWVPVPIEVEIVHNKVWVVRGIISVDCRWEIYVIPAWHPHKCHIIFENITREFNVRIKFIHLSQRIRYISRLDVIQVVTPRQ